ncbi:hypothetical protein JRQ81_001693, partial [Phrynocephalus forsythii]
MEEYDGPVKHWFASSISTAQTSTKWSFTGNWKELLHLQRGCSHFCLHAGICGLDTPSKQYLLLLPCVTKPQQSMRRFVYCKVVLATSLMWVLVDVFLLLYFSECNKCDDKKERSLLPALRAVMSRSQEGPGEMGKAVLIPKDDQEKMKELFKINQFNLMASDMIALNRSLPDVRLEG